MKDIRAMAALIAGTVAVTTVPVQAKESVSCKVGKQEFVFEKQPGKRLTPKQAIAQQGRHKDSYTEVEWTYLKKIAPELARKDAIKCGVYAFIKIGDIKLIEGADVMLGRWSLIKGER